MSYQLLKPTLATEIKSFLKLHKNENIVLDLENISVSKDLLLFLTKKATKKQKKGTSFVVISSTINIDDLSEELNIVPTLQEAVDIIDMEEMMRDLA